MAVAVFSIGTELTRGEIVNTNASWLSEQLTALGFTVTAADTVDDDVPRIVEALQRLAAAHEVIVCTGGLGPTTDDMTSAAVAEAMGVPLVRDEPSLATIRERMSRFGRTMAASNEKQADFPAGAVILPNGRGTAPGFGVRLGRAQAFFMPGVPHEMKTMFEREVAPRLADVGAEPHHQVRLRTFGLPESTVNDRLAGIEAEHGVVIGYRAHFPEIEVKVLARDPDAARAARRARAAADEVRARLAEAVFAEGDVALSQVLGELCLGRNARLATAESCTGGQLAALLTEHPGASAWYAGGVVAYSNALKVSLLGVPPALIEEHGAVSEEVARAMALGARERLGVEVAVSLTGVAGPGGGTAEKPVGLVHYAVATPVDCTAYRLVWPGLRGQVQRLAAFAAMMRVRDALLE